MTVRLKGKHSSGKPAEIPVGRSEHFGCFALLIGTQSCLSSSGAAELQPQTHFGKMSAMEQPSRFCCRRCVNRIILSTTETLHLSFSATIISTALLDFLPFPSLPPHLFEER